MADRDKILLLCNYCRKNAAIMKRSSSQKASCKECFCYQFEEEILSSIIKNKIFNKGDTVCLGASGGKDSTVLIHSLNELSKRHDFGVKFLLLSIDEGISGYRDDSLETVQRNKKQYNLPLKILSYSDLYKGWTMDRIVKSTGYLNNCSFCGVFRRQALERGALEIKANKIATGHNADDTAETVLMNIFRGDFNHLVRCTGAVTACKNGVPRCKPLEYSFQKEIVLYAYYNKLDYFSTHCIYSPDAFRGDVREFVKELELIKPSAILNIIKSGETFKRVYDKGMAKNATKVRTNLKKCVRCGYVSSNEFCQACFLLESLEKGMAKVALGRKRGGDKPTKKETKLERMNLEW